MMSGLLKRILVILSLGVAAASSARAADPPTADHVTAEVVSVNALNRTLVVRISGGTAQTVELDDSVAGFGPVKAGDRLILTLRREPGRAKVTWLARDADRKRDGKDGVAKAASSATPGVPPPDLDALRRTFSERTAALAEQASRVDALWRSFHEGCDVKVAGQYEGAREWFSLWDTQARADLSSGFCRDLFDQIVSAGSDVTKGMADAEDGVRNFLLPGAIRDIRRRYSMDWEGWSRPAPAELDR
jgi:hypothetical protein